MAIIHHKLTQQGLCSPLHIEASTYLWSIRPFLGLKLRFLRFGRRDRNQYVMYILSLKNHRALREPTIFRGSHCGSAVKWWNEKINKIKRSRVCSPAWEDNTILFRWPRRWPLHHATMPRENIILSSNKRADINCVNKAVEREKEQSFSGCNWVLHLPTLYYYTKPGF
jgi:hypothetical protein